MLLFFMNLVVNKISLLIYKILGPTLSTHLSSSFLGKFLINFYPNRNKFKIYSGYKNIKVKLNFNEAHDSGFLFLGAININETKFIEKILKSGDVVVDVGAYVDGWYTLFPASIIGKSGHVYSFEPSTIYFDRLKENVVLNNFSNITLVNKGLSDKEDIIPFYVGAGASGMIKDHLKEVKQKLLSEIMVKTTTLDQFVKESKIKKIDLIKIDVEGWEMKVLKGCEKTIKKMNYPDFIVEVVDDFLDSAGSSQNEIFKFLAFFGYKPYFFTHDGIKKFNIKDSKWTPNIFFTKKNYLI